MHLKTLKLNNFRCFSDKKISFEQGINIVYGLNAVGKTSLLEAINYLALTKSFKEYDDSIIFKEGLKFFSVNGSVSSFSDEFKLKILRNQSGKTVFKNDYKFSRISDYVGEVLVVSFSNDDLFNLNKGARERRKIFEPIFCQISKDYVVECNYYKKILNERNALLKRLTIENNKSLEMLLLTLDLQLVEKGKKIIEYRKTFIERIRPLFVKKYSNIVSALEDADIVYKPSCSAEELENKIRESKKIDMIKGTTNYGPHKDDYVFIINNKNIIDYGSQGQQRSVLISLKMAFVDFLYECKNDYPILLLDDVLSELDVERQNNLLQGIDKNVQAIISTATLSEINKEVLDKANIITLEKEM